MDDIVVKKEPPVHLILGTSEYVQIKTETTPKIGKASELQTSERTHQKPVPTRGTSRRFKTSVPPSQNARKGQGRDAASLDQRSSHQKSGKLTFHDGTIRFVHPSGSGRWGAVIDQHLDNLQHIYPNEVEEIRRSLYVDDLIGGERSVADARHLRQALQSIFRAG